MIKTILHLDDKEYNVLKWSYSIIQNRDTNGRPTGPAQLRRVIIVIEAIDIIEFLLWANHPTLKKQLMLQIMSRILGGKSRKVSLVDCHCVGYVEEFNANSNTPRTIRLELTCGGLEEGNAKLSTIWRTTHPNTAAVTTINRNEDDEPELIDCYYTDLEGNEDTELETGKEVYLVVKTENMVGETRDIDLSNHKKDFIYRGERLEDDTIKGFNITSDLQKIKLKIVAQQEGKNQKTKNE